MSRHLDQAIKTLHLHEAPAILYTLYLPLHYNDGSPIPSHLLDQIQQDLFCFAGGLTRLPPAVGWWNRSPDDPVRDVVMPVLVMVASSQASDMWFAHKIKEWMAALGQDDMFCVGQTVQPVAPSLILPSTNGVAMNKAWEEERNGRTPVQCFEELTPREREVLALLVNGKSDSEIAAELVISMATLDHHLNHIYKKLDVPGRYAAIVFAICMGYLPKIERIPHRRQE